MRWGDRLQQDPWGRREEIEGSVSFDSGTNKSLISAEGRGLGYTVHTVQQYWYLLRPVRNLALCDN